MGLRKDFTEKRDEFKKNLRKGTRKFKKKAHEIRLDVERKLYALLFIFLALVFIALLFFLIEIFFGFNIITWFQSLPYVYLLFQHFFDNIAAGTNLGIYYTFSFASIFLFPIPYELIFLGFLKAGAVFIKIYPLVLLGILTGQHINYFLGRFFGVIVKRYVKKKTRIELRKRLNKYGGYAIFGMHLFPLPYAIFNFIVGLTRYPYWKWLMYMLPALCINYFLVYLFYLYVL